MCVRECLTAYVRAYSCASQRVKEERERKEGGRERKGGQEIWEKVEGKKVGKRERGEERGGGETRRLVWKERGERATIRLVQTKGIDTLSVFHLLHFQFRFNFIFIFYFLNPPPKKKHTRLALL